MNSYASEQNNNLPQGLIYVDTIDRTILQQLRYTSEQNFVGQVIPGYRKEARAVLSEMAAKALSNAQKEFLTHGYSIVIYDTYRPQSSVDFLVAWAEDLDRDKMKNLYYPYIPKAEILNGYLARKSGHTRASTVDMSIIKTDNKLKNIGDIVITKRKLHNGQEISYLDDGSVDMGGSFDLFHEASFFETDLVSKEAIKNRKFLENVMNKHDFQVYSKEWWHFTLKDEPFKDTYFDFAF